jgi:citronellyl-CoA dehydrogenase
MQHTLTDDHIACRPLAAPLLAKPRSTPLSTNGRRPRSFRRKVFRKMGKLGFLGVNKPVEFGGRAWTTATRRPLPRRWDINCGGMPMAIGVQTDMATPALARFGSDELRRVPGAVDQRRVRGLPGRVGSRRRLRRGVDQDPRPQGRRRLRHQRRQDVDHQRHAGRLVLRAGQHQRRRQAHRNKTLICVPMKTRRASRWRASSRRPA